MNKEKDIISAENSEENKDVQENAASADIYEDTQERKHLALKRTLGIISVVVFFALMAVLAFFVGKPLIEKVFGSGDVSAASAFQELVDSNPVGGRILYVVVQILQVFIALIPGEVVEIAGGLAFGAVEGLLLSLLGVAIGSSVIFMLTKTLGIKFVELFVSRDRINEFKFIRTGRRLEWTVFYVFLIPGTPKDILTYIVGLTRMKLLPFLAISLTARIPSVLSSTWGGDALMNGEYTKAIIIFAVAFGISLVGALVYNIVKKVSAAKESKKQND